MNRNSGTGRKGPSKEWVKGLLRAISAVEPPPSLRERLRAGIPAMEVGPIIWPVRSWSQTLRWAGAAGAVLLAVSAVVWLGTPRGRHTHPVVDTNGCTERVCATDHNGLRSTDANVCDINGLR